MKPLLLIACLTLGSAPAIALDRLDVPNADFKKSVEKAGPDWTLTGAASRFKAAQPFGRSLLLKSGAELSVVLGVTPSPEQKDLSPEGWYVVASVDVLGCVGAEGATLLLEYLDGNGKPARQNTKLKVSGAPPEEDSGLEDERLGHAPASRHYLRVPSSKLTGDELWGHELHIRLSVSGEAGVVIDNLRLERFHAEPLPSMCAKPNGKNGPDLLGAGMLGFTGLTEHLSTSFSILAVREGGPAGRAGLRPGDLVVDVEGLPLTKSSLAPGWDWFEHSNEAQLGRAIEKAIQEQRTKFTLGVLREDGYEQLKLKLPLKAKSLEGFPFGGKTGEALREDLLSWTVLHQRKNGGWPGTDAVNPAMGGLALLGTRDKRHAPAIKRCVEFLLKRNPSPSKMTGLAYWTVAYQGIFFAEYYLASGDERMLTWMSEASEWLPGTTHESKWGMQAFGHGPSGLPYDNKSLMAPTAHLLVYDALARQCGVESRLWEHVREYVVHSWSDPAASGHGGMGYNASYKDKAQFWSRSGLTALAAALRGENGAMRQGLCLFMQERHPWMLNSHAYGEPGAALGLLSLAVAHRPAYDEVLPQWRWRFLNGWEPGYGLRYSTPHMGAPYMGKESIVNLSYAMLAAVENRGLVIAGGEAKRWLE